MATNGKIHQAQVYQYNNNKNFDNFIYTAREIKKIRVFFITPLNNVLHIL